MPHLKRSQALALRVVAPPLGPAITPTQEALHLRCPTCGLLARLDLVEDGPYAPLYSRLQRYGGNATIIWESPLPATDEEYALMVARLEAALERLRSRPAYIPPVLPPPPPPLPPVVAVVVPPFSLAERPGRRAALSLIRHLQRLEEIGTEAPEVEQELDRLADELQQWIDQVEEAIAKEEEKEEPDDDRLERLQDQKEAIEEAQTALSDDRDVPTAIEALERAFPARPPRVPPLPIAERLEAQARAFRPRIQALRERPDRAELERLEQEMTRLYDRVVDSAEVATGETRQRLHSLALRLERSAEAFALAYDALARRDTSAYLRALDALLECCPA